jgi:hypothetical protein
MDTSHKTLFATVYIYRSSVYALGGLAVSEHATGPTGHSVAGSSPTEGGGFLWVIKIPSAHFLRRRSKAVGPMSYIYGM